MQAQAITHVPAYFYVQPELRKYNRKTGFDNLLKKNLKYVNMLLEYKYGR